MTNATMNREFNPSRSPLFGIAAVVATAVTMGIAVLLPMHAKPSEPPKVANAAADVQRVDAQAPAQVVTLPVVEVTATRPTRSAANLGGNVTAVYRQKS